MVAHSAAEAVDLASKISQSLSQLQVSPGDEGGAQTAEQELRSQAKRASKLADSL